MKSAIKVLVEMKERYEKELAHLIAQRDGVEKSMHKAQARLETTIEALASITGPEPSAQLSVNGKAAK